MESTLHLPSGEVLELEALAGEILTTRAPHPFPPGTPLALELRTSAGTFPITAKSVGSKRHEDGSFELRLRLVSLRRDYRSLLEHALSGDPSD